MKRDKTIVITSIINIIINVILSALKIITGIICNSISITSDGINNLGDTVSSIIAIIGTKLAAKKPDKDHPYGHGRLEYIASLVVSALIIYAGITTGIASVKKIVAPEEPTYTLLSLILLVGAIIAKILISIVAKKKGKEVNSPVLIACGKDAFNDVLLTSSVLLAALLYILFNISIEAYIGLLVSTYIFASGVELVLESVKNLLGLRVDNELAIAIKKEVEKVKEVQGAYDLHLSNYGPENYIGSIHIEVSDKLTVADIDKISRTITKNIYDKYGVTLHTIGVYSVNSNKKKNKIKEEIEEIVFSHKEVLQMHGFYIDEEDKYINIDIVIDYNVKDKETIYKSILNNIKNKYKGYKINITLDIDTIE